MVKKAPNPPGLFLESFDLRNRVLGRPDDGEIGLDQLPGPDLGIIGVGADREHHHVPEVVDPGGQAVLHVFERLFSGLGDVHWPHQAPVGPVGDVAVLGGPFGPELVVLAEHVEAAGAGGSEGEEPGTESAGRPGSGR